MSGRQRMIVSIVALLALLAGVAIVAWGINQAELRTGQQKIICFTEGGIWTSTGCAWSNGGTR